MFVSLGVVVVFDGFVVLGLGVVCCVFFVVLLFMVEFLCMRLE